MWLQIAGADPAAEMTTTGPPTADLGTAGPPAGEIEMAAERPDADLGSIGPPAALMGTAVPAGTKLVMYRMFGTEPDEQWTMGVALGGDEALSATTWMTQTMYNMQGALLKSLRTVDIDMDDTHAEHEDSREAVWAFRYLASLHKMEGATLTIVIPMEHLVGDETDRLVGHGIAWDKKL